MHERSDASRTIGFIEKASFIEPVADLPILHAVQRLLSTF
jgi:hypothetical protein